jgi:Tol biopolymer transport system component
MDDRVIAEPEDIYDLRLSPDGQTAAYINRDQKALFIVNLPKSKVAKVSAYQARACFVNPVYSSDGSELIYIVENLKDSSVLSLEWVDSRSAKVLCRLALESGAAEQPTVLALNEENTLLAVGDAGGRATLLDMESGKIITSWQAAFSRLIGLTFAQNGKILVSLDESGEFAIWGIQ